MKTGKLLCVFFLLSSNILKAQDFHDTGDMKHGNTERNLAKQDLAKEEKKLRDKLISGGFIDKQDHYNNSARVGPGQSSHYFATNSNQTVNANFQRECPDHYRKFFQNRQAFVDFINKPNSNTSPTSPLISNIETFVIRCIVKIFNEYKKLEDSFIKPINRYYLDNTKSKSCDQHDIDRIKDFSFINLQVNNNAPKNFQTIKEHLIKFERFQKECIESNIGINFMYLSFSSQSRHRSSCLSNSNNLDKYSYSNLKSFFEKTVRDKSCFELRDELIEFSKQSPFTDFIKLPESHCNNLQGLKSSNRSECQQTASQFLPLYPHKEADNLFSRCKEEIDNTYTQCFGEEGRRTELQQILNLVNQKSNAVCEEGRWNQIRQAEASCKNIVQKCMEKCKEEINHFKTDFQKCFFLPDFNSYTILHKENRCPILLGSLEAQFKNQAKEEPFKVDFQGSFLKSLDYRDNRSVSYPIKNTCKDVLKENQIDQKIRDLQAVCQKNSPEQQTKGSSPFTIESPDLNLGSSSGNSSNRNPASKVQKSVPFSYEGNNTGNFTNSTLPNEEPEDYSSSGYNIQSPSGFDDTKDKRGSISADFKQSDEPGSNSANSYNPSLSPSPRFPNRRAGFGQGDSQSENSLAQKEAEEEEKEDTESLTDKFHKGVRNLLSSKEEYGIIDNERNSSATSGYLNWFGEKSKNIKKKLSNAYDGMVGIDRAEFKRRLHLNEENVNLFEVQRDLFMEACKTHNCDRTGASPEIQNQIHLQNQLERNPSSQL